MVTNPEHARKAYCLAADFFVVVRSIRHMSRRNDPCHSGRDNMYRGFEVESLSIDYC